jgi:hypothetical protein
MLSDLQLYALVKYSTLLFSDACNCSIEYELFTNDLAYSDVYYRWSFMANNRAYELCITGGMMVFTEEGGIKSAMPLTDEELKRFSDVGAVKYTDNEYFRETVNPQVVYPYIYQTYDNHVIAFEQLPCKMGIQFGNEIRALCLHVKDATDGYDIVSFSSVLFSATDVAGLDDKHLLSKQLIYTLVAPKLLYSNKSVFSVRISNTVIMKCGNREFVVFYINEVWHVICAHRSGMNTVVVEYRDQDGKRMRYTVDTVKEDECFLLEGKFNDETTEQINVLTTNVAIEIDDGTKKLAFFTQQTPYATMLIAL